MQIQLSDHFTYKKLLRFTLPSIFMMVFVSIYSIVDGFFVSNFVGKTPFAALNLIWPFVMICGSLGFMIGTGGSALVGKTMGEGDLPRARALFSLLIYVSLGFGVVIATVAFIFIRPIAVLLGATPDMLEYCVIYGRILLLAIPFFMLQNEFQSLLITAERPDFGLKITVAAGIANMIFDALFVVVFRWGLAGAAAATALCQTVGGLVPLIYFILPNKSPLRLGKTRLDLRALGKVFANGSSEFVTNISLSLVGMIYNLQLLKLVGEDGVSAYGVVIYVSFIFIAVFLGYTIGAAPIVSFHFGAGNTDELKNLRKKGLLLIACFAAVLTALGVGLAQPQALIFVSYDKDLLEMTVRGVRLYSFSYLIVGFNIFGSSFFTALNDGLTSATISFVRTLVFQIAAVLLLPALLPASMKLDGIWLAAVAAELLSLFITSFFLIRKRKKYHY